MKNLLDLKTKEPDNEAILKMLYRPNVIVSIEKIILEIFPYIPPVNFPTLP